MIPLPESLEEAAHVAFGDSPPEEAMRLLRNGFVPAPVLVELHAAHEGGLPDDVLDWTLDIADWFRTVHLGDPSPNDYDDYYGDDDDEDASGDSNEPEELPPPPAAQIKESVDGAVTSELVPPPPPPPQFRADGPPAADADAIVDQFVREFYDSLDDSDDDDVSAPDVDED